MVAIDGKPIIAYVIDLSLGENFFIFVCNQDHLNHTDHDMESILKNYCSTGKVIGVLPHKLGPFHAVQQVFPELDLREPLL